MRFLPIKGRKRGDQKMAKKATRKPKCSTVVQAVKGKPKAIERPDRTDEEEAQLEAYRKQVQASTAVKFILKNGESLMPEAPDDPLTRARFAEALGTTDGQAQGHLFSQAIQTFPGVLVSKEIDSNGTDRETLRSAANQAAALLAGIQPRDELESMLATQMIACHNAAMDCVKQAMIKGQTRESRQASLNNGAKLMQVFTHQMETLRKRRTGGQQKMVVEHVHVNEGGQAVVGTVNVGGASGKTGDVPHAK